MMAYRTDSKTFSNLSLRVQDMWPDNCLFHAVHGLDKAQAGIKITGPSLLHCRQMLYRLSHQGSHSPTLENAEIEDLSSV